MALKRCKQCGMLKEETCFRPYTHSRGKSEPSRYRICRDCESINTTYRRAREQLDKGGLSLAESSQLSETVSKILQLYRALEAKGLKLPLISCLPFMGSNPRSRRGNLLSTFLRRLIFPRTSTSGLRRM